MLYIDCFERGREVLAEIGIPDSEIATLIAAGVLGAQSDARHESQINDKGAQ